MPDPKRNISYTKARFRRKAQVARNDASALFRRVQLGNDITMDEVYTLAKRLSFLGGRLDELIREAVTAKVSDAVLTKLYDESFLLSLCSTGLHKVAERFFGFTVKALPVYEPSPVVVPPEAREGLTIEGLLGG